MYNLKIITICKLNVKFTNLERTLNLTMVGSVLKLNRMNALRKRKGLRQKNSDLSTHNEIYLYNNNVYLVRKSGE